MCLAVSCDRKERAFYCLAVEFDLDAFLGTAESFRLLDVDIVARTGDGYLNIKFGLILSENRLYSQSFARELNAEALEER